LEAETGENPPAILDDRESILVQASSISFRPSIAACDPRATSGRVAGEVRAGRGQVKKSCSEAAHCAGSSAQGAGQESPAAGRETHSAGHLTHCIGSTLPLGGIRQSVIGFGVETRFRRSGAARIRLPGRLVGSLGRGGVPIRHSAANFPSSANWRKWGNRWRKPASGRAGSAANAAANFSRKCASSANSSRQFSASSANWQTGGKLAGRGHVETGVATPSEAPVPPIGGQWRNWAKLAAALAANWRWSWRRRELRDGWACAKRGDTGALRGGPGGWRNPGCGHQAPGATAKD
jgi:hypothetical protein